MSTTKRSSARRKVTRSKSVTSWGDPDSEIPTAAGRITYREWCEGEAHRMNQLGDSVSVETRQSGNWIALVRKGRR